MQGLEVGIPPVDAEDICLYSHRHILSFFIAAAVSEPGFLARGREIDVLPVLQASLQSVCLVVIPSFRTPTAAPPSAPAGCSSRPCRSSSATTPSPRAGTSSRSSTSQPACPPSVWRWEEWWFVTDRMMHFKAQWGTSRAVVATHLPPLNSPNCVKMDFASVP